MYHRIKLFLKPTVLNAFVTACSEMIYIYILYANDEIYLYRCVVALFCLMYHNNMRDECVCFIMRQMKDIFV